MNNNLGKQISCAKMYKDKNEADINIIKNKLNNPDYEIRSFIYDHGRTDNDYEFITIRFYCKKKN